VKHHGLIARVKNIIRRPTRVGAFEPWGRALQDHLRKGQARSFYVHDSNGLCIPHSTAEAFLPTDRFRTIQEKALSLCQGRVLDVGAGAGRHSLQLTGRGLEVLAIDIEPRCVEIMHARGLPTAMCADIHSFGESGFDTILVLEQTIGFAGTLDGLVELLAHLAQLLCAGGQIILDSMSPTQFAVSPHYPGQRQIEIHYGRYVGAPLCWLYVDFDVLRTCAKQVSLDTELVMQGPSPHDYLARVFEAKDD
jgi:SAM-dependent methyltransferase